MNLSQTDSRRATVSLTLTQARAVIARPGRERDRMLRRLAASVADNEIRCPDCLSPPGTRHYCGRYRGYVEAGRK